MDDNISRRLLNKIKNRRLELGFSQEYIANSLGLKQTCYSKIELGQNKLTVDRLFAIFKLLGLSTENLLGQQQNRSSDFSKLFYLNRQPMWLFEPLTLRFLEVNEAAVQTYNYSRDDFGKMTLFDIRPVEYANWLRKEAKTLQPDNPYTNISNHKHRSGLIKEVLVTCYPVLYEHGLSYLAKAEPAPVARGLARQLQEDIFHRDQLKQVNDGRIRSRFAELRFLATQLDTNLPATAQDYLLAQIQELLSSLRQL